MRHAEPSKPSATDLCPGGHRCYGGKVGGQYQGFQWQLGWVQPFGSMCLAHLRAPHASHSRHFIWAL